MRLIVMWSVPFNLNLYDTYMGLALIYNEVEKMLEVIFDPSFLGAVHILLVLVQQDVLQVIFVKSGLNYETMKLCSFLSLPDFLK